MISEEEKAEIELEDEKRKFQLRKKVDREFEYNKWINLMPEIKFPEGWSFIPLPPYKGAICRFIVIAEGIEFSVYLDCYGLLGYHEGDPYWEVFSIDEGFFRCDMQQPEKIIEAIQGELARCKSQK